MTDQQYCPLRVDHEMVVDYIKGIAYCTKCRLQLNRQERWIDHDSGLEKDLYNYHIVKQVFA